MLGGEGKETHDNPAHYWYSVNDLKKGKASVWNGMYPIILTDQFTSRKAGVLKMEWVVMKGMSYSSPSSIPFSISICPFTSIQ